MNLLIGFVITIVVTALAITAMLLVRRRAPEGSYFTDGDRASGVFGVLASGFAILLGFIIFLAFTSYDESRAGAESRGDHDRPAGGDGPVLRRAGSRGADRRARLLRPLRRRSGVGPPRGRLAR